MASQTFLNLKPKFIPQDPQSELLTLLIELHHTSQENKQDIINKISLLSNKISYLQNYPKNPSSFWNAESFMWTYKIDKDTRQQITLLLQNHLPKDITPLDLGCGAYSYIPSIGFDISPKMLDLNDNLKEKIMGDIEQPLPFQTNSHQAITAIFLLNYITNLNQLLTEINRILTENGIFIAILSKSPINEYHLIQQKQTHITKKWQSILQQHFNVTTNHQENLLIFICKKRDNPKTL